MVTSSTRERERERERERKEEVPLSKRCSKRSSRLVAAARPSNFTACNFETQAVMRQSMQRTTTAARDVRARMGYRR
jgi:hypothetical protein